MQRRWVTTALAAALALGAFVVVPARAYASSEESRFTSLLNHERSARGLSTLAVKSDLVSIARRHSQRMAASGRIYHNGNLPNEVSGGWTVIGENVGRGGSADSIHRAFMSSASHRANILRRDFNQVGVGTAIKGDVIYVTEVFAKRGATRAVVRHTVSRPRLKKHTRPRVAAVKRARPRPAPPPAEAARTVAVLVRLVGLDARQVNPVTGAALGI